MYNYKNQALMTVEEIKQQFTYNYKPFWYFRSVWDNYQQKQTGLADGDGVIPELARLFTKNKNTKYYKPLGDFKDFNKPETVSQEDIYNHWLNEFNKVQFTIEGPKTFKEVSLERAYDLQNKVLGKKIYTPYEIARGLSFMLWRCAEGMRLEIEVLIELQKRFNTPLRKIKAAPGWYETYDVDAVMINEKGQDIMYISIKNLGALSEETMNRYRAKNDNKKKPMIYMGFNDKKELKWLRPEEWSHQTLKEHLASGKTVKVKD